MTYSLAGSVRFGPIQFDSLISHTGDNAKLFFGRRERIEWYSKSNRAVADAAQAIIGKLTNKVIFTLH